MLKPLALAAGFILLAAIVAFGLAQVRRSPNLAAGNGKPLGVPVGIPENAAVAAPDANAEPSPSVTIAAAPDLAATDPPALVSNTTEPASAVETGQEPAPTEAKTKQVRPAVAFNPTPALPLPAQSEPPTNESSSSAATTAQPAPSMTETVEPAKPVVAVNTARPPAAEPTPRAEAPAAASRTAPSDQSSTADDPPQPATLRKPATSESERLAKAAKKPSTRMATRGVRRAEPVDDFGAGAPPLPRGARRARFVGTAPDGSLMFELPSQERVYASPSRPTRDRSRPRRPRQVIDGLPVLPAEPVFEGNLY